MLVGGRSIPKSLLQSCFALSIFKIGSHKLLAQAGLEPWDLCVDRITTVSHRCPATDFILIQYYGRGEIVSKYLLLKDKNKCRYSVCTCKGSILGKALTGHGKHHNT
jgi:hypothetical protein